MAGAQVQSDRHPAYRVNRKIAQAGALDVGAINMNRFGDVSESKFSERLEFDAFGDTDRIASCFGEKDLVAPSCTCHPGGDVDRCTQPVRALLDSRACVHADVDDGKSWLQVERVHYFEAEPHCLLRLWNADHDGVADGLDLLTAVGWEQFAYHHIEGAD